MKKKKHAVVVLDATGSMIGQGERVVSSMNEYAAALPKKAGLTVFLFDSERWDTFFDGQVKDWKKMKTKDYRTGAMTPLYDAIGKGIDHAKKLSKKGDKVMVMVDTDGQENASKEFSFKQITDMIEKCKKKGWEFMFMANAPTEAGARIVGQAGGAMGMTVMPAAYSMRSANFSAASIGTQSYFDDKDKKTAKKA